MRYSININQYALTNMKSKIKFEEAVLLDYIFWLCTSPSKEVAEMRKEIDGNVYTWFDYNYYIKETPMAKGRTKPTLTPKIRLLEEEQWIETRLVQTGNGERKYVRILEKCDSLLRNLNDPVKKTKRTPLRNLNIDNNTIKNNTNIDNNISNSEELQSQELVIRPKKEKSTIPDKTMKDTIDKWKAINPLYKDWYGNITQRKSIERLLTDKDIDESQIKWVIDNLEKIASVKFMPNISTPHLLLKNWSALVSQIKKQSLEKKGGINVISAIN